jgi:hypothetical protein
MLGICIMLWLPFEDTHTKWAVGFGAAIAVWFAARKVTRIWFTHIALSARSSSIQVFARCSLAGLLAGLAVTPLAFFLMVFKTGLHSHGIPDFTYEQAVEVLHRTPFLALSGLFLGLGSGFAILSTSHKHANRV